jgi:hypothetical protein
MLFCCVHVPCHRNGSPEAVKRAAYPHREGRKTARRARGPKASMKSGKIPHALGQERSPRRTDVPQCARSPHASLSAWLL